jgi:hypothetical protein
MAQIIPFIPTPVFYPSRTALLDAAELALLSAVRCWVAALRQGEDPVPGLCRHLHAAGARDAAFSVDALMAVVARTVRRPIAIRCPHCPRLSADERHLLHAASLVQAGAGALAERALRNALLSAQGAAFALGPLEGLGALFAGARLLFGRRHAPAEEPTQAAAIETGATEAWAPADLPRTLH